MQTSKFLKTSHSNPVQRGCLEIPGILTLTHGKTLTHVNLAYSVYGDLRNPCVLILGGISAGRDIAHRTNQYASGWWSCHVGLDKTIDLNQFCVLGIDYLGGNGESTGPRSPNFDLAVIDSRDQALAIQYLLDHLQIEQLNAVIGSSYGGMVAQILATDYTHRVSRALVISAAHRSAPISTALREVQRQMVRLGQSASNSHQALVLARALAMISYRSADEFSQRFDSKTSFDHKGFHAPVFDYLLARGQAFADQFNANAFCLLSQSIDLHRVDPTAIKTPLTLVAVEQDQLIPKVLIEQFAASSNSPLIPIHSNYGHDAFLKEQRTFEWIIKRFLRGYQDA